MQYTGKTLRLTVKICQNFEAKDMAVAKKEF